MLADIFPDDLGWIELDAMSAGHDIVPIDSVGVYLPPGSNAAWSILAFSVDDNVGSGSGNGDLGARLASGATVGNDVYAFGALGSLGIDDSNVDTVVYSRTMAPSQSGELAALDYQMALRAANNGALSVPIVNNSNVELYFSVSVEAVNRIPNITGTPTLPPNSKFAALPDPGVIYRVRFASGSWGPATVFRSTGDLGLVPGDNVDAIAVEVQTNDLGPILFSTDKPGQQLKAHLAPGENRNLVDRNNVLITTRLGLGPDDNIDALCNHDPEVHQHSGVFATPSPTNPRPPGRPMTLGVSIEYDTSSSTPPTGNLLRGVLSGWNDHHADGTVTLYAIYDANIDNYGVLQVGPSLIPLFTEPRTANQDRFEFVIARPGAGTWALIAEHRPDGTLPGQTGAWSHAAVMNF